MIITSVRKLSCDYFYYYSFILTYKKQEKLTSFLSLKNASSLWCNSAYQYLLQYDWKGSSKCNALLALFIHWSDYTNNKSCLRGFAVRYWFWKFHSNERVVQNIYRKEVFTKSYLTIEFDQEQLQLIKEIGRFFDTIPLQISPPKSLITVIYYF